MLTAPATGGTDPTLGEWSARSKYSWTSYLEAWGDFTSNGQIMNGQGAAPVSHFAPYNCGTHKLSKVIRALTT